MTPAAPAAPRHPFARHPHRTLAGLALPVLGSLLAEPLTGLVDTAFVARIGAAPLAALGIATALLSSVFWVFNFLGIGTQTEAARQLGSGSAERASEACGLALAVALALGTGLALLSWPFVPAAARFMSPDPEVQGLASVYLRIRLLGGPAVLVSLAAFGALRGAQDMRTPLWIALLANAANLVLDAVLIFGLGPVPALGVAGAAWASTASAWLGAGLALRAVRARLGLPASLPLGGLAALLGTGRDLSARTGLLLLFVLLATRSATQAGVDAGAAHQAVRQVWMFTAFALDAVAVAAQTLVASFLAVGDRTLARRVAAVACGWGLCVGVLLALVMLVSVDAVALLLVPGPARPLFPAAWLAAALAQPLNALSFVTDGIHWGTGDYRYLRNAMLAATAVGVGLLAAIDLDSPGALLRIWLASAAWISVRSAFGLLRIWPGLGAAPLR